MAKVYAYLRYSSDRQSEGDSYERQTRLADAYALANGLTIHHWIRDEGVSAYKGANAKRGKLSKFIADVITGEIEPGSTLLVESVDRLSREAVMDALDTYTTLIKSGLTIVTLMDGLVHDRATYDREWPRLMLVVAKMAVAREESEKKSDRSKSQWKARREDQSAKRMVAFLPLWLEAIDKPNPERVALINRMFREIADLNFGVSKIASRFNDEGIPAWGVRKKSGKAPTWHGGSILNIVRGRSVLGEFQPMMDDEDGKSVPAGPLISDYYPEIVDPALYYRAQKALDGRQWKGGGGRKGESVSNLFSKLAKCAHCNGSLYRRGAGAGRFYLSCSGGMRKVCENRRSLPYDRFEETFLKSVVEVELPGSVADDGPAKDRLALAEHKRATLQTKIDNFVAMIALGTVSAALGQALQKAEAEAADLDIEVGAARDHLLEVQSTPAPNSRMAALREFVDQMNDPEADKLVVRSRLASAIASVVDDVLMDAEGVMTVIIMDGLRNYQIDGDRVIRADAPDYSPDRVFNRGDGERAAKVRRLRAA